MNDFEVNSSRVLRDTCFQVVAGTFYLELYFSNEYDGTNKPVSKIPYNNRHKFQLENAKILEDILDIFNYPY